MSEETVAPTLMANKGETKLNIYDLSPAQLEAVFEEWGQPSYRARQVLGWLYKEFATDFTQMTNLPLELRRRLTDRFRVGSAELVAQQISKDGWTRKVLLKMRDGNTIEAVLMLYYDRATVCVSSQVGCAMGCTFCATGQMGFTRNLTSGEILEQVIWFDRWLGEHPHRPRVATHEQRRYVGSPLTQQPDGLRRPSTKTAADETQWHVTESDGPEQSREIKSVTNIVFMGMGEPLVNYNNLWGAIRLLTAPQGLGMSPRRLTVSTVGIAPQIIRFGHEPQHVNLAVSLHAPNDDLRASMMPIDKRYPISVLLAACKEYERETNRRVTFEYVLINGENDSPEMAQELAGRLKGLLSHVNLIPLNPVPGTGMQATPRERVFAFQKILEDAGISATVRIERGVDIAAACGQLKVAEEPNSRRRSLNPDFVKAHVLADLGAAT